MTAPIRLAYHHGWKNVTSAAILQMRALMTSSLPMNSQDLAFPSDATPQGVQGSGTDDCITFKLWLDNCRRYGLANCDEQLQGIQTGRKTLAEVMAEQERLIAEIADQYRANLIKQDMQGIQDNVATVLPDINMPCPQGIQGEDCERFKLWLENCHRFGFSNCMQQLQGFQRGRKTLVEIFEEQDRAIREAAGVLAQSQQSYSTLASNQQNGGEGRGDDGRAEPEAAKSDVREEVALTSRQKLRRAAKEYGSTVMIFHISISLMSLGFFYSLVNNGIDVVGILSRIGIGGESIQAKIAGGTGTFVVAYAVHKVFAPARIAMTVTATPLIVRYLRRVGFLKAPKPKVPKS